jgi:hypothetical protein
MRPPYPRRHRLYPKTEKKDDASPHAVHRNARDARCFVVVMLGLYLTALMISLGADLISVVDTVASREKQLARTRS